MQVSNDRVWKRHIDHVREMHDGPQQEETQAVTRSDSEQTDPLPEPFALRIFPFLHADRAGISSWPVLIQHPSPHLAIANQTVSGFVCSRT